MSPYATLLSDARILALNALIEALKAATDPAEIRRIATAIFKAPRPDEELDRSINEPQPAPKPPSPSATSPERSEGTPSPEPATPPRTFHSNTPSTHTPAPSLRSGLVAHVPLKSTRPQRSLIQRKPTRAARLLDHSGRAPRFSRATPPDAAP